MGERQRPDSPARAPLGPLDPTWRRAGGGLLRSPAVLAAVLLTAALLGLTAASGPLFAAAAANAALRAELARLDPVHAGLTVTTRALGGAERHARAERALRERAAALPELGAPVATLVSAPVTLSAAEGDVRVRLLARSGALEALPVTAGAATPGGVSLPAGLARATGARAHQSVLLEYGGRRYELPVAALHADLEAPLDAYWRPLADLLVARPAGSGVRTPQPVLVTDHATLQEAAGALRLSSAATWQFPLAAADVTLDRARRLAGAYREIETAAGNPRTEVGAALADLGEYSTSLATASSLRAAVAGADRAVAALLPPVRGLSLAGVAVALVVLGAAGAFRARRRRVEHALLTVQGVGAGGQAARALVEAAPAIALGVLAGAWAAARLVGWAGPPGPASGRLAAGVARDVALAGAAGLAAFGVVTAVRVGRDARVEASRLAAAAARLPWELPVLALAAASYQQLSLRGSALVGGGGGAQVDVLLLAFPLLFLAGAGGLLVRLLRRALPALRRGGARLSPAPYLAARRLAGASVTALLLVVAAALSLGVLVYGGALAGSAHAAARAKATVATGADAAATLPRGLEPPATLPAGMTAVHRGEARLAPAGQAVDVLALDPATFAAAASWDDAFADAPLGDLLARLRAPGDGPAPVLVAGGELAGPATLRNGGLVLEIVPAASARAFPAMSGDRPLVVLDRRALHDADRAGALARLFDTEVWARGAPQRLTELLAAEGLPLRRLRTAAEVRDGPALRAIGWTLDYLRAVGALAAGLTLAATLLYLGERQQAREVSYALASRMGLDRRSHRRAVALELAGMLTTALVIGATLALVAARLVASRLDPLPQAPPAPEMVVPALTLAALALAVGVVCWAGAWAVQQAADHAPIGEVLRAGD